MECLQYVRKVIQVVLLSTGTSTADVATVSACQSVSPGSVSQSVSSLKSSLSGVQILTRPSRPPCCTRTSTSTSINTRYSSSIVSLFNLNCGIKWYLVL